MQEMDLYLEDYDKLMGSFTHGVKCFALLSDRQDARLLSYQVRLLQAKSEGQLLRLASDILES